MKKILILAACATLLAPLANAEVYKYIDENGNVSYSSVPVKGAKPVKSLPGVSTYSSPNTGAAPAAAPAQANTAPAASSAPNNAQKQALQKQLVAEKKSLADAQKALADGKNVRMGAERNYAKYQERIKGLEGAVNAQQSKVQSLESQLNQ